MASSGELVYLGCYTRESGGGGQGIVAARRDPVGGGLDVLGTAAITPAPSFLAWHPSLPVLYAVNELDEGRVSAWAVADDGALTGLGTWSTEGAEPCHLAVSPDGAQLFVANYGSGSVCVLPLDEAGMPGEHTDLVTHEGHGADPERQEQAHAHMVSPEPRGGGLLAVDLGTDAIYRYDVDPVAGRLLPRLPPVRTAPGTGPRHLARNPDGLHCHVVGELDATVTTYGLDLGGTLHERGRAATSTRPGKAQPSEIAVGRDGRFLYVANRGVGTVSVFAVADGLPSYVTEVETGGSWPRHFAMVGDHLYVVDERANTIEIFAVDPGTGVPAPAGGPVSVPSPTCVLPQRQTVQSY
ncbi:lactonase family protein [Micromonospora polyrhachis]|nr:lactonase family protein [Micromonospora polyrhachis]